MAETLILEFEDLGPDVYDAVNRELGIDPRAGAGDWPAGLQWHGAGATDDGGWTVIEVWESREAQSAFMQGRLGAALQAGGVTAAPKVTWVSLVASHIVS
jgi:hypothetical protein